MSEQVILVNQNDQTNYMDKAEAHQKGPSQGHFCFYFQ